MYSREERMKAIELYIKYDRCAADVARELGYPDRKSLVSWYEAYLEEQETGGLMGRVYAIREILIRREDNCCGALS